MTVGGLPSRRLRPEARPRGFVAADAAIGNRLERVRGQLAGVRRMLDEGRECADIVVQLMAIRAAVEQAANALVLAHVNECLETLPQDKAKQAVKDALQQLSKLP